MVQMSEDVPSHEEYVRLIREQQVDGLILSGPSSDDPLLQELAEEHFPLVLHGSIGTSTLPCVDVDNRAGAYQAVTHLLGLGHDRIGFISNAPLSYSGAQERFTGYQLALEEHNVAIDDELVEFGTFLPETGERAMRSLLQVDEPPTAVFAASDVVALGALSAVHQAHLNVPADVALVGFDDILLSAHAIPPLTTVRVPAYGLGWTSAEIVVSLIEGEQEVASVTLETELVVRESCGAMLHAGS
jgi:LacI family transcriptional regulator